MIMSQYPHQVTELTGAEYAELLGPDWYADDDESVTICDRCGEEIPLDEANDGTAGEWEGAALCNECYAKTHTAVATT